MNEPALSAAGVGNEIYYPLPLHRQECFRHLPTAALPVSDQLASEVISIPIFPELTEGERTAVVEAVVNFS
jgi:dTDP-4-amino-4,6-dideoxygalactose transaminase